MANPKIGKLNTDIAKAKAKIAGLQARLRELEREKVRLEDLDIVALVRSERISDAELNTLMASLRRDNPEPAGTPASAMEAPEPAGASVQASGTSRQEDTRNANRNEN